MIAPASRRAFTVFRLVLGLGILFLAARTAIDGVTGTHSLPPLLIIGAGIVGTNLGNGETAGREGKEPGKDQQAQHLSCSRQ